MFEVRRHASHFRKSIGDILSLRQDTSGAPGALSDARRRSLTRYRGILLGGGFAGFSKVVGLLSVAITVPLTVGYLEPERYGMWMTISSMLGLLGFADLGIGNGMVSSIAGLDGARDAVAMRNTISSAFFMLSTIAAIISIMFAALYQFVPWQSFFAVQGTQAAHDVGPSVAVFIACFVIGMPFSVVQRLQLGLQESWRTYTWQIVGSLISLFGTLLVVRAHLGIPWLIIVTTGGPVAASIINSIVEFGVRRPQLRPQFQWIDRATAVSLLRSGGIFVALQLSVVVGTASDSIIIAHVTGVAGVSRYAVMYKLFQIALVFSLFMSPLWPAMGDAISRGDYAWARSAMRKAVGLCLGAGAVLAVLMLFFAQTIIRIWVGPAVVPNMTLVAGFCLWVLVTAYGGAVATLLNNNRFLRIQLKMFATASVVSLLLKVPMTYWLGPAGVVWATVIGYFFFHCIPAAFTIRRTLHAAA